MGFNFHSSLITKLNQQLIFNNKIPYDNIIFNRGQVTTLAKVTVYHASLAQCATLILCRHLF